MEHVIEVKHLVKRFKDITAVDGVDFQVQKGEVFGLLGPNGAGKTTTLEIIEGLQLPTSGEVSILGMDIRKQALELKQRIGVQLQSSSYYEFLKVSELLELFGSFYKKARPVDELLELVELREKKHAYVKELSGGQQQRFSIISSLVNDPDIVFLDEPTTGLDPQARHHLWNVIRKIHNQGKTVVLTTHYMEEAQELSDRIAIMDTGKIIALDTPKALIANLDAASHVTIRTDKPVKEQDLKKLEGVQSVHVHDNHAHEYRLDVFHVQKLLPQLMKHADSLDIVISNIEIQPPNLEDVFLSLTGKSLRE